MGLLLLFSASLSTGCASNSVPVKVDGPAIPASQFDCAEWPAPPPQADVSQAQVAAWLEAYVQPAWADCKEKLAVAKKLLSIKK